MIARFCTNRESIRPLLSHHLIGSPGASKVAVFLHGILGSKKNWRTPIKIFLTRHPDYKCLSIDLRGHGMSSAVMGDNNLDSCVEDLVHLFRDIGVRPTLLSGHSFGGKVVLKYLSYLMRNSLELPHSSWILDSLPGIYDVSSSNSDLNSVLKVFAALRSIPSTFRDRAEAHNYLLQRNLPAPICLWLEMNLVECNEDVNSSPRPLKWAFNLNTVSELFDDFCSQDLWHVVEAFKQYKQQQKTTDSNQPPQIHFVRAGKNSSWTHDIVRRFDTLTQTHSSPTEMMSPTTSPLPSTVRMHVLPKAGHWVHVDDLEGLMNLLHSHAP